MNELLPHAIAAIDEANSLDPNGVMLDGKRVGKEVTYAQQMTRCLYDLEKKPSEVLQLAARAQHICRWEIGRRSYPSGRIGYLQWRTALYAHHAERAGEILQRVGYDSSTIEGVGRLLRKQGIKTDPEMQTLEDVICLVFVQTELEDFARRHPDEKVIDILRKTWRKMSERGHAVAMEKLPALPESVQDLLKRALG